MDGAYDGGRTAFLREQTVKSLNKIARAPIPPEWNTSELPLGLCQRKAEGLAMILKNMPLFIGGGELIVGTRTLYGAVRGSNNSTDIIDVGGYSLYAYPPYINAADVEYWGFNNAFSNKTHCTPDYSLILELGVDGVVARCEAGLNKSWPVPENADMLKGVIIAYKAFAVFAERYAAYAEELAKNAARDRAAELLNIARVCRKIAHKPAETFQEAVQLLWFAHIAVTAESFEFVNYGRLDVILGRYLKDTDPAYAQQLIECLLLKMYDQADIKQSYLQKYAAQLNVTIGGVDSEGNDAVNPVTFMFLEGLKKTRLPDPLFSIRLSSKNPPGLLRLAAELTVGGMNNMSYYNDDLLIESMIGAGVEPRLARQYAFDLCQDMNIPGRSDWYCSGSVSLAHELLEFLKTGAQTEYAGFGDFLDGFKSRIARSIRRSIGDFNAAHRAHIAYLHGGETGRRDFLLRVRDGSIRSSVAGRSFTAPLPFLSGLFHGCVENAVDVNMASFDDRNKGYMIGCPTEGVNGVIAIKKLVFDDGVCTLADIWRACEQNYEGEGQETLRARLWNAPKWGNDDDYADGIAKEILEFACDEILKYKTADGGRHLAGIHQPHPVPTGQGLMATPEGRKSGTPTAVTLTPESGTMKAGPTAALKSAAKLNPMKIQWNICVMATYYATAFRHNAGAEIFENLLKTYFKLGGLQHQPNVLDAEALRAAQLNPEGYRDLIVRLWGVSAHFVDLPRELQDEVISRLS